VLIGMSDALQGIAPVTSAAKLSTRRTRRTRKNA
jgi:hypothetical protein